MVTVQQVHHISVSALTLDNIIMVFKAKHEVHFCEGSIEDGGEECYSERLLLKKRRAWESCSVWKVPQEAAMAVRGGWDRRKEWHKLCHVGKLQQQVSSLLPVLSLCC